MENSKYSQISTRHRRASRAPIWKSIAESVIGAAFRLHRYRDAQDALLRRVFYEQELRMLEEHCCNE